MPDNVTLDIGGLRRTIKRIERIGNPDAAPLMLSWMKILDEGNRRGVMAGLDGAGNMLPPVTYRPRYTTGKGRLSASQRNVSNARVKRGTFQGYGPHASGLHGNLTGDEYQRLSGPPLAPRGEFSRVITNFRTDYAMLRAGYWQVTYWWQDVVSIQGVSFLRFHFEGQGRYGAIPIRDLRGIRPDDKRLCNEAARAWLTDAIRTSGG